MTADLTPAPDVAAWLDELERLHAAWQVGGWDGFEAGLKLPHAVPRLVAAVRAVEALADEFRRQAEHHHDQAKACQLAHLAIKHSGLREAYRAVEADLRSALTATLASERTTP